MTWSMKPSGIAFTADGLKVAASGYVGGQSVSAMNASDARRRELMRLLFAAPDLLAACKLYLAHATTTSGEDSLLTDDERRRMEEVHNGYTKPIIIDRMQAAIAKAEGQ